jgi:DMSO/TMAO reductase YedYZ molybdopterin-dependent catalytic subunit
MENPFAGPDRVSDPPENRPSTLADLMPDVTPIRSHYRRNHFPYPQIDLGAWRLEVGGAVRRPAMLGLRDLREMPQRTLRVLLECAGHRRTDYLPPAPGVQWGLGALSQADWTGVALADVLSATGPLYDAVEVVLHGADRGAFAEAPGVHSFSRSLPLAKALHPDTVLALAMNGEPLPVEHGAPVRAITPGWYAMDSVKWLTSIEVVTAPFRGVFQELDYRFQPAGGEGIGERIDETPIHSLFVSVSDGDTLRAGASELAGIAWGGGGVAAVEVRVDAGPWALAKLEAAGSYERARWSIAVDLGPGLTHELAVRATDVNGRTQPAMPIWNKRGYVNNSVQRISVIVP